MKTFPAFFIVVLLLSGSLFSCNKVYQKNAVQYYNYRISSSKPVDPKVVQLLKPYTDSVNLSMNYVVGFSAVNLEKKQPEGSLGNFMADAILVMAKEKFGMQVDAAFLNYGGVRLTEIAPGAITRGKVYELMPFDNLLVLQKVNGMVLQEFLDRIASRGGWPLSGVKMQIKDKKAVNVEINGKPLESSGIYTIANSDYIANGGDDVSMLKDVPQINFGYLIRNAVIDYLLIQYKQGISIKSTEENRITNAQ